MEDNSTPSNSFSTRSARLLDRQDKVVERLRSANPGVKKVIAELLEVSHDRLLFEIPAIADPTKKLQQEGAVLEYRRLLKKLLE
jgi:hypothetical protein